MLSCDHVMKGAEGDTNVTIVQPSLLDTVRRMQGKLGKYINKSSKLSKDLTDGINILEKCGNENQLTKDEIRDEFDKCCQKTDQYFAANGTECKRTTGCGCKKCKLEKHKEKFFKIYTEQPRNIATYMDGVRGNVKGANEEEGPFYVDAAIAKLEDSKVEELRNNGTVQLADPSKTRNTKVGCFPLEMKNLDCKERVYKCGRTTSTTYGFFETLAQLKGKSYPSVRSGCNKPRKLLFHVSHLGCQSEVSSKIIINLFV